MRYVKAVLAGLLTGVVFAVCTAVVMVRITMSRLNQDSGGVGHVSFGIPELAIPLGLGFALGFWWILRRTRVRTTS
jgi:MFS superfamily sulfate permease-like transporter